MNQREHELFEAELHRLKPARLPEEFESRLNASPPMQSRECETRQRSQVWLLDWPSWLRWLAPLTAVAVALLAVVSLLHRGRNSAAPTTAPSAPTLRADQIEIDRQLLGSFDAVANMPDGEPVRFRFQQWMEAVTLRDSVRGVEVVQRIPRIEVVPVSFATY
jgi:negative regulator of sigma E activity